MSYIDCTQVTAECPVSGTLYGYRPNVGGNAFFLSLFALCSVAQIVIGAWKRLPAYAIMVSIGTVLECLGYAGRLMMHENPWSDPGFKLQIVCLVLAPSFLAAGIYLTFKHLVRVIGPDYSRIKPAMYPRIFITCDFGSIVLQGLGGGLASGNGDIVNLGNHLIVAGIAFQVATQAVCFVLAADFAWRWYKARRTPSAFAPQLSDRPSGFYLISTGVAFLAIFIRCIYRIPEMAGGWGNPLMQDETTFLILDGAMIAVACILMSIAHPGIFFPEMRLKNVARRQRLAAKESVEMAGPDADDAQLSDRTESKHDFGGAR